MLNVKVRQGRIQDLREGGVTFILEFISDLGTKRRDAGEICLKIDIFSVLHWVCFPLSAIEKLFEISEGCKSPVTPAVSAPEVRLYSKLVFKELKITF